MTPLISTSTAQSSKQILPLGWIHLKRSTLGLALCGLLASQSAWAQEQSLVLQVPVRISGIPDASLTHVHVQCVVDIAPGTSPAVGTPWGAAAQRIALSRGTADTVVNMPIGRAPGSTGSPGSYRCFMAFTRGEASFDFISPASLGGGTVVNEVSGRL